MNTNLGLHCMQLNQVICDNVHRLTRQGLQSLSPLFSALSIGYAQGHSSVFLSSIGHHELLTVDQVSWIGAVLHETASCSDRTVRTLSTIRLCP